jgi:malonyl-CoA O-methyltransferase
LIELIDDYPENIYHAVDLSVKVMEYFALDKVEKKQGNLTDIPYEDAYYDVVYTCEALEHAVDIEGAIREMARVTKDNGNIVVVDKNKDMLGYFEIEEWEQWFDEEELKNIMLKYCSDVRIEKSINFDNNPSNGLFYAWIGTVKK